MNIFLDSFHARKIKVVQLLQSEDRFFTILELSETLNVTASTIEKAVESLVEDFTSGPYRCQIQKNYQKNKKIKIKASRLFSIEELKRCYMTSNFLYQSFYEIFTREFEDVKTYAEKNFTSLTMAYKKFSNMEPILQSFGLKFNFSSDFELVGTETQIRYFYLSLFWSVYDGNYWPFDVEPATLTPVIDEIEKLQGRRLPLARRDFYYHWLGVIVTRLNQGYYVEDLKIDADQFIQYDIDAVQPFYDFLIESLEVEIPPEHVYNEVAFLSLITYAFEHQLHFQEKMNFHRLRLMNAMPNNIIFDSVNYFMKAFEENSSIRLGDREYNDLYLNLVNLHTRVLFFEGEYKDFQGVNTKFLSKRLEGFFSEYFDEMLSELAKDSRFTPIFSKKKELSKIYTMLLSNTLKVGEHIPPIRVSIISVYGDKRINYYRRVIQFSWFEEIDITAEVDDEVDLIITDRNYHQLAAQKDRVFVWSEHPTAKDIAHLNVRLDNILIQKAKESFWFNNQQ